MSNSLPPIGIIAKQSGESVADTIGKLLRFLQKQDRKALLDESLRELVADDSLDFGSREEIGKQCKLAIVIGGDGSFLNAARSLADYDISLTGINMGRLGFMVDVSPDEFESAITKILAGEYIDEERLLLKTSIERDGKIVHESLALNDVVIHTWDVARMIEMDTYVDTHFVCKHRADGLIISTPTGSTAYALSSGGPILHPTLDVVELVPICPHTLTNRPIVISSESMIDVLLCSTNQSQAQITCDGQTTYRLMPGDVIKISQYEKKIHLVHPKEQQYFDILRRKLKWGHSS